MDEAIKVSLRELEVHVLVEASSYLPVGQIYVRDPSIERIFQLTAEDHVELGVGVATVVSAVV